MVSSGRRVIICILLILGTGVCLQAQTTAEKVATASISGKVTLKGKPAVKVTVVANETREDYGPNAKRHRAKTDQTGNYRIPNLPAGTYYISALTPALVPANQSAAIVVSDGEPVEDVNISLAPGGVITGKITDSDGEPLIGEPVSIMPVFEQRSGVSSRMYQQRMPMNNSTDDRGIYRAFGLAPGKYRVSVGNSGFGLRESRQFKETFYPSVTEAAKATVLEVTEGSETKNVDIVLGRPVKTFRIAGRVIDGETGDPIPNINYGVGRMVVDEESSHGFSSSGGEVTNANGEFRYENATPGKYMVFIASRDGSDFSDASISFEVVDRDLTDLVIKVSKGSSMSGVVVLEGNERASSMLRGLRICAGMESSDMPFITPPSSEIGQDGSFRINGVRSGVVRLWLCYTGDSHKQFEVVSVERNGVPQPETINVKGSEQVAGLRVTLKYIKLTGSIRGQLKVENGELPPTSELVLSLWPLDENLQPKQSHSIPSPQLDPRGRFFLEGLPAGTYRLSVYRLSSSGRTRPTDVSQQVIVRDDTVTEVTLIMKPQP